MKIGMIITTSEPETVWSALRLANKAMEAQDEVDVFLLGPGVDYREAGARSSTSAGRPRPSWTTAGSSGPEASAWRCGAAARMSSAAAPTWRGCRGWCGLASGC